MSIRWIEQRETFCNSFSLRVNCADNDVHISRAIDWDILLFFENSKYPKLEFSPLNSSDIVSICSTYNDDLGARSKLFLSYMCALSSDSEMIEHLESYTH